jgi:hypothetical protein
VKTVVGTRAPVVAASGLVGDMSALGHERTFCDAGENVRSVPIADKRLLGGGYMQTGITFEKELEPPYGKRALAYCW